LWYHEIDEVFKSLYLGIVYLDEDLSDFNPAVSAGESGNTLNIRHQRSLLPAFVMRLIDFLTFGQLNEVSVGSRLNLCA